GTAWGGYLTLLGLGLQAERWAAGVALAPVADTIAAYEEQGAPGRAQDRAVFGGTPAQAPQTYHRASPLTYVDRVRAPLRIVAYRHDTRGPRGQIEGYVEALRQAGRQVRVRVDDLGHGRHVDADRIDRTRDQLAFVHQHLATPPAP